MKLINRRDFLGTAAATAGAFAFTSGSARSAPVTLRYANVGAPGSSEINTIIFSDRMKRDVVETFGRLGKIYTYEAIQTSGTPEAATLLAAGQVNMATFSFGSLASVVLRNVIPSGVTVVADGIQEGRNFSSTFCVLDDSPIRTIEDLRGKRLATNAVGAAVDVLARVVLKNNGIDPQKDIEIVELSFANMAAALREKRIDCGCMILPFWPVEQKKGDLRPIFDNGQALGPASTLIHVASNDFLKQSPDVVRAFLADYYDGLAWMGKLENRPKALEYAAEVTGTPVEVLDAYLVNDNDYYHAPDGCLAAEQLQKPIDAMVDLGMLKESVDVKPLIDLQYLPGACS